MGFQCRISSWSKVEFSEVRDFRAGNGWVDMGCWIYVKWPPRLEFFYCAPQSGDGSSGGEGIHSS